MISMPRLAFWSTVALNVVWTVAAFRGGTMPLLGLEAPGGWAFGLFWLLIAYPLSSLGVAFVAVHLDDLLNGVLSRRQRWQGTDEELVRSAAVVPLRGRHRRSTDGEVARLQEPFGNLAAARADREAEGLVDHLTGLLSRPGLLAMMPHVKTASAVAVVTIDRFIHIVEHHGQRAAEQALREIAEVFRRGRTDDLVARWDDTELVMLLPNTSASGASARLRRLLEEIQDSVQVAGKPISLSAAIADAKVGSDLHAAVADAHQALSRAKPRLVLAG